MASCQGYTFQDLPKSHTSSAILEAGYGGVCFLEKPRTCLSQLNTGIAAIMSKAKKFLDKVAVDAEPGLSTAQLMVSGSPSPLVHERCEVQGFLGLTPPSSRARG